MKIFQMKRINAREFDTILKFATCQMLQNLKTVSIQIVGAGFAKKPPNSLCNACVNHMNKNSEKFC